MQELIGIYNKAKIFTENIDEKSKEQIIELCNQPVFENSKIRIMPDVHAGKGCVIGFTADMNNRIIPNLIGVDIGCGVIVVKLGAVEIDFLNLDKFIRKEIPHGTGVRTENIEINDELKAEIAYVANRIDNLDKLDYHYRSLGSLGGGNHFIEIGKDDEGNYYLLVHSGSRHFGNVVANYFQKQAIEYCKNKSEEFNPHPEIEKLKSEGKTQLIQKHIDEMNKNNIYDVPTYLSFLEGELAEDYFKCMKIAQKFANINRQIIVHKICNDYLNMDAKETFTTIHNYIDENGLIRKGAVSAQKGEKLVIPANMRDGALIAIGKGNSDWNNSAPHGAGRLMSRTRANENLSLDDYKNSMEGVFTTSVCKATLDEAPMAYKPIEEIISAVNDTIDIISTIKPVYNFKAKN
ncbi:MAG: RtcB family protein [bacterium]